MSFKDNFKKEEEEEEFTPFFQAEETGHSFFDRENSQSESAFALFNLQDQTRPSEVNLKRSLIRELDDICDEKMDVEPEKEKPKPRQTTAILDTESKKWGLLSHKSGRDQFKHSLASSKVQDMKENSKKSLLDFSAMRQLKNSRVMLEGTPELENSKKIYTESKSSELSFSFKGKQEEIAKLIEQKETKAQKIEKTNTKKFNEQKETPKETPKQTPKQTPKETNLKASSLNHPQRQELKFNMSLRSSRVRQERTVSKIIPKQEFLNIETSKRERDPQIQINGGEPLSKQSKEESVNSEPRLSLKEELARRKTLPLGKLKSIASKTLDSKISFPSRERPEKKEEPMEIEGINNSRERNESLLNFKISKKEPLILEQSSKGLNYLTKYENQIDEINAEMERLKSRDNALHNSYQDIHIFLAQINSQLKKRIHRY